MHEITADRPDPLDSLLAPASPPDDSALRQALLARTLRTLRWRRRCRQLSASAALAACLALALLTICWAPGPAPVVRRSPVALGPTNPPEPAPSALVREWRAFDATTQQAVLYRQAGDEYLNAEADPQSAVRCYTAALDESKPEDLHISLEDSWLLMAIKEARQKEKVDAN